MRKIKKTIKNNVIRKLKHAKIQPQVLDLLDPFLNRIFEETGVLIQDELVDEKGNWAPIKSTKEA